MVRRDSGMGSPSSAKAKSIVAALVLLVVALSGAGYVWVTQRLAQTEAGVCSVTGTVLSDQAIRKSIVDGLVNNALEKNRIRHGDDTYKSTEIGVIRRPKDISLRTQIEAAFNNGKSVEENFSITRLNNAEKFESAEELPDLVIYNTFKYGSATLLPSRAIAKALNAPVNQAPVNHALGFFERLRGFGTTYYQITQVFFIPDCCNNKRYGLAEPEYLNNKHKAYLESRESFDRGLATHVSFVAVSTCGELLTESGDEFEEIVRFRARSDEQPL